MFLFRPGDNPNQCAQGYNCPPPTLLLDNFDPIVNRYIDVGAGGPATFTFTVSSNASWIQLSQSKGTVSPTSPEQRVFAGVKDWSQLAAGKNVATLTFTATTSAQKPLAVDVVLVATKYSLPSGFKGMYSFVMHPLL